MDLHLPIDVGSYAGSNNIGGTPEFVNPNGVYDFSFDISGLELLSSSPLVGSGRDTSSLTDKASKDFNGKTRTDYNIGAF